ncbi:MAG: cysteine desulfurase-like protein [Fimbriimonadaceae bacterium]|nr:cysteine desulfurase-like protein [Fimbriimonadaceae bacterium]QYK57739.1 MAG: cysteine desulfurase-like protein [Fimbriimonadaceae bacterium]
MKVGQVPSLEAIRAEFPALRSGFVFLENAGGSQVPQCVIDAMGRFMVEDYVQTGAGYPASDRATDLAARAKEFVTRLVGGEDAGCCVFGASATALISMLAECWSRMLVAGDEIVVSVANHEANIGAWLRLERLGIKIVWWGVDPESGASDLDELAKLFSPRTRLVAYPMTSNLLGDLAPVRQINRMAHDVGAKVVVDGVAFTSHGLPDVLRDETDFFVYSCYKVYGPHVAVMFGRTDAWADLKGPNHFFVRDDELPRKFELGCLPYESLAGVLALGEYLGFLAGSTSTDRETMRAAYERMGEFEHALTQRLMGGLHQVPGIRIAGPLDGHRVPTVSFKIAGRSNSDIVRYVQSRGIGIRSGHMYSYRLCEALGVEPEEGFVRVSAVHTNTPEEIDRFLEALSEAL